MTPAPAPVARAHRRSASAPLPPGAARFSAASSDSPKFTELAAAGPRAGLQGSPLHPPQSRNGPKPSGKGFNRFPRPISLMGALARARSSVRLSAPATSRRSLCRLHISRAARPHAPPPARAQRGTRAPRAHSCAQDAHARLGRARARAYVPRLRTAGRHVSASVVSKLPLLDIWHSPEVDAVLNGMAMALHAHLASVTPEPRERFARHSYERFSERLYPLESDVDKRALANVPSSDAVRSFLAQLHDQLDIDVSILIVTLIFVERVLELNAWPLLPDTWRRMLLAGLLAAAKVLFDELVWNVDMTEAFPDWNLADINELELHFCDRMGYSFHVRSSTYANFYFSLVSLERRSSAGAQAAREAIAQSVGSRVELKSIEHDAQRHASPLKSAPLVVGVASRRPTTPACACASRATPTGAAGAASKLSAADTLIDTPLSLMRRLGSFP